MQHKDKKVRRLILPSSLLSHLSHILRQLLHCILQCSPCIINLIDNQDVLPDQVRPVDGGEVEPLGSSDLVA